MREKKCTVLSMFYQWKEVIPSTGTDQMNAPGKLHLPAIKNYFFFFLLDGNLQYLAQQHS